MNGSLLSCSSCKSYNPARFSGLRQMSTRTFLRLFRAREVILCYFLVGRRRGVGMLRTSRKPKMRGSPRGAMRCSRSGLHGTRAALKQRRRMNLSTNRHRNKTNARGPLRKWPARSFSKPLRRGGNSFQFNGARDEIHLKTIIAQQMRPNQNLTICDECCPCANDFAVKRKID